MPRVVDSPQTPDRNSVSSALFALGALILYLLLAPAASGDGDGSEFTLVLATNGVTHPTGYPFYVLFGHLFCRLLHAAGVAWPHAANAWSAVGAATALFFLHRLSTGLLSAAPEHRGTWRHLSVLPPLLLLALNPIWTNEAMLAEVYSWHLAWVGGASWLFARIVRRAAVPAAAGAGTAWRDLLLWGLACGLGLAHHLTSVLVSAPLSLGVALALGRARRLDAKGVAAAVAGVFLPLLGYGILYWRAGHPAVVQWPLLAPGWTSVLQHITGEQYRHFLGYFDPSPEHRKLLAEAGYPILGVGLAGLALLSLRARAPGPRVIAGGLLTAALLVTLYGFNYGVPDPAPYFLPAMSLGLAGMAPLLDDLLRARRPPAAGRWIGGVVVAGALAALLVVWGRQALARRAEVAGLEATVRSMWGSLPPDSAIVLWPDDRYLRLREYQLLRGEKPNLTIANPEVLLNDLPRARFVERFGVDPLRGLSIPRIEPGAAGSEEAITRFLVQVVRNVTDQSRLPVILFDPSVPVVRVLRKSADAPRR